MRARICLAIVVCAVSTGAFAEWAAPDRNVPIPRILANMKARLVKSPTDYEAILTIARLHSLAFARETEVVDAYGKGDTAFSFVPWESIQVKRTKPGAPSKSALEHLGLAIENYRIAASAPPSAWTGRKAEPEKALLGYAWTIEQAAPWINRLAAGRLPKSVRTELDAKRFALDRYRVAYEFSAPKELKGEGKMMEIADRYISVEAANNILRLVKNPTVGILRPGEAEAFARVKKELERKAGGITPIVFSFDRDPRFSTWLSKRPSRFDLVGDGIPREYEWVSNRTAFLAWDPRGTGVIRDARQLFGSGTFWMEFGDGYRALRALDDNGDGWLTGRELKGIVAWVDRNGNGKCDPGEVVSLKSLGVVAIRARSDATWHGMLASSVGLVYSDGTTAPTLDWVTTGVRIPTP